MVAALLFLFLTLLHGSLVEAAAEASRPTCLGHPLPVAIKPPYSSSLQTALDGLTSLFNSIVTTKKIPALSATLIVGDDIIWSQGFGKKNLSDPQSGPPNGSTVFRIGSITKVLTEMQLLQVRDQGLLHLDDPITKLLPAFRVQNPYASRRQITLSQLAGHQSGLLKDPPCDWGIGQCNITTAEALDLISTQMLLYPPGTEQSYSNTGITLLARGMETVTNTTWENAVTQSILTPLRMNNTSPFFRPQFLKNFAVGYIDASDPRSEAPQIDLTWFRPTGNGYSTTDDLAKLVSYLFQYDNYQVSNPVLDAMTIRDWLQIVALRNGNTLGISHPWETIGYGNYTLFTKNGGISGYFAEIGFFPELKLGFTIAQTLQNDPSFASTWLQLSDFLLNVVEAEMWNLQPPPALPGDIDQFAGTYSNGIDNYTIVVGPWGKLGHKHIRLLGWPGAPNLILDWLSVNDTFQMSLRGMLYSCMAPAGGELAMVHFVRNSNATIIMFQVVGNLVYDSWAQQNFWKIGIPKPSYLMTTKKFKPQKSDEQGVLNQGSP